MRAEERGIKPYVAVLLLLRVYINAARLGTATLYRRLDEVTGTFAEPDAQSLPDLRQQKSPHCFCTTVIVERMRYKVYPFPYGRTEELTPPLLDLESSGVLQL